MGLTTPASPGTLKDSVRPCACKLLASPWREHSPKVPLLQALITGERGLVCPVQVLGQGRPLGRDTRSELDGRQMFLEDNITLLRWLYVKPDTVAGPTGGSPLLGEAGRVQSWAARANCVSARLVPLQCGSEVAHPPLASQCLLCSLLCSCVRRRLTAPGSGPDG